MVAMHSGSDTTALTVYDFRAEIWIMELGDDTLDGAFLNTNAGHTVLLQFAQQINVGFVLVFQHIVRQHRQRSLANVEQRLQPPQCTSEHEQTQPSTAINLLRPQMRQRRQQPHPCGWKL